MRVVLLLPGLERAGAETRTVALALALRDAGCAVTVATVRSGGDPDLRARLDARGISVRTLRRRRDRRALRKSCAVARRYGPVVLHSTMTSAGLCGVLLRGQVSAPLLHSFTNTLRPNRTGRHGVMVRLGWAADTFLVRQADAIHAVSRDVGAQLRDRYPAVASKITVLADVTTEAAFEPGDPAARILSDPPARTAQPKVLALGRLAGHKGHDVLLDALPVVARQRPGVHVVMAGTGTERARLERRVTALGVASRVTFAGLTCSPRSFLDWADVVVHASSHEGLSRACIEASMRDVPVIVGNTPAAREHRSLLGGEVRLVPGGNAAALARALLQIPRRTKSPRRSPDGQVPAAAFLALYALLTGGTDETELRPAAMAQHLCPRGDP